MYYYYYYYYYFECYYCYYCYYYHYYYYHCFNCCYCYYYYCYYYYYHYYYDILSGTFSASHSGILSEIMSGILSKEEKELHLYENLETLTWQVGKKNNPGTSWSFLGVGNLHVFLALVIT